MLFTSGVFLFVFFLSKVVRCCVSLRLLELFQSDEILRIGTSDHVTIETIYLLHTLKINVFENYPFLWMSFVCSVT